MNRICLIGDILVDVTLKNQQTDIKLRLGGLVHAARCLWAMDIPYSVGYFAPAYLDIQIQTYLRSIDCTDINKLGNVTGSPYVFLVNEAREIGDQGYEFLLRDEFRIENDNEQWESIAQKKFDDYLLISGNYDTVKMINQLSGNIHLDLANNISSLSTFELLNNKLRSLFISTSSNLFKQCYANEFEPFCILFKNYTERLILKENRGGSRCYDFADKSTLSVSSQTQPIVHSIGVGDVYNAVFVSKYSVLKIGESLTLSSWIAAEYAVTTYPDDFKKGVKRVLSTDLKDLVNLKGVLLPWELRSKISIYIAGPDFDYVDTTLIDAVFNSLKYNNFNPIRPILQNGQMEKDATKARKRELFNKDMALLEDCSILIAVLLFHDPGTLIELGYASAMGMPTILFDPFDQASNCMLTELPTIVSNDLDEVIAEIFTIS